MLLSTVSTKKWSFFDQHLTKVLKSCYKECYANPFWKETRHNLYLDMYLATSFFFRHIFSTLNTSLM